MCKDSKGKAISNMLPKKIEVQHDGCTCGTYKSKVI
jgi:hypothetical protein